MVLLLLKISTAPFKMLMRHFGFPDLLFIIRGGLLIAGRDYSASGFRVQGLVGFRVQGVGFRVSSGSGPRV